MYNFFLCVSRDRNGGKSITKTIISCKLNGVNVCSSRYGWTAMKLEINTYTHTHRCWFVFGSKRKTNKNKWRTPKNEKKSEAK